MLNFTDLCVERPVGTQGNNHVLNLLRNAFSQLNFIVAELPFECTVWQSGKSYIEQCSEKAAIFPGPFSNELTGIYPLQCVSSLDELTKIKNCNGVLFFRNELTQAAIMPKNFPFYFPDEDKLMYDIIEAVNPKGIIAISGQDPVSGLNPFPIFEDANLEIPNAYTLTLGNITEAHEIAITLNSHRHTVQSRQQIFRNEFMSKDIIVITAHMDSKYGTKGAVDNASGLYTLYETAKLINAHCYKHSIEIVPFNGEDSPEVSGQLAYLKYLEENNIKIKFAINIDGVGYTGMDNLFSFYNFDDTMKAKIIATNSITEGDQWYSGDHSIFAFQEIPCIAVTSANTSGNMTKIIHTQSDTPELVDLHSLRALSEKIAGAVKILDEW